MSDLLWQQPALIRHSTLLLDAFEQYLKRPLLPRQNALADAEQLFHAPFVVVSHGIQADPILNYGNQAALTLWHTNFTHLTRLPSRQTAEPMHQAERAQMLQRSREHGFIDDYQGIRISCDGRRFSIKQAIIWNVQDEQGQAYGQAATFAQWEWMD